MPYMRKHPETVKVHRVNPDHKVKQVHRAHREIPEQQDLRDLKVNKDIKVKFD